MILGELYEDDWMIVQKSRTRRDKEIIEDWRIRKLKVIKSRIRR